MKHLYFWTGVAGVAGVAGCGRIGVDAVHVQVDGGESGGAGGATALGTGGKGVTETDAAGACPQTAFTTAPLECSQDWSHAETMYGRSCQANLGGYRASCAPYDAIAYVANTRNTWCFYAKTTGNLIGSFVRDDKGHGDCKSFDLEFAMPDVSACTAVSGAICGPDAGM